MKRKFNFEERVIYNHLIEIEAESEELLDEIEDSLGESLESREVGDKELLFSIIENMGGKYTFVKDGSPEVEYE